MPIFEGEAAGYQPEEMGLYRPYEVKTRFAADDGTEVCANRKYSWRSPVNPVVIQCGDDVELLKIVIKRWYRQELGITVSSVPGDIYEVATGKVVYHGEIPPELGGQPVSKQWQQQQQAQAQTGQAVFADAYPWLTGQMIPGVPNWLLMGCSVLGLAVVGGAAAVLSGRRAPVTVTGGI